MSRLLWIPALSCLLAFACLCAYLAQAADSAKPLADPVRAPVAAGAVVSPVREAERMLGALCDDFSDRWRSWEESPHRLLSRAMPRPLSPMHIEFAVAPPTSSGDQFLLATIRIDRERGEAPRQTLPCVVAPSAGQIRLFQDGAWKTGQEWLQSAPSVPVEFRGRADLEDAPKE